MSWESISTRDLISIPPSHKLSATHLLASPDGSRHPLDDATADVCQFDDSYSRLAGYESSPDNTTLWHRRSITHSRYSILDCFFACQRRIRQYFARRKIERGLRLYEQHNQNAAVKTWRSALKSTNKRDDRFQLLGYLYQGHMDWGKYREALEYGHRQLGISEELDSPSMRAEAYLNLARAHERLGGLERALSYARHSLYNECGTQCRSGGLVHLTVARVYLEMGGFSRALEGLQGSHKIAAGIGDPALELQVYVALSELFGRLQDTEKSARYASKAYDLSRSLQLGDLNSSHHRAALLRMAASLRKQGELGDAHDYCTEATRLALISGDQATFTRSIRIMGDIYRKKMDIDRAFRQYEQAMGTAAALGDRMAQMEAMDGAARCLEALRLQQKICNCRPLEFNTRLLEVASSVGAKLLVRKIRSRLALIYRALGDEEQFKTHSRLATQAEIALGLHCGACNEVFGIENDSLEALPCAHILHARCAHEIYRRRDKTSITRTCPACNKILSSRSHLYDDDNHIDDDDDVDDGGNDDDDDDDDTNNNGIRSINSTTLLPSTIIAQASSSSMNGTIKSLNLLHNSSSNNSNNNNHCNNNNGNYLLNNLCDMTVSLSSTITIAPQTSTTTTLSTGSAATTTTVPHHNSIYRSNLSLASLSLRASSLTIDSECHATSSV